MFKEKIIIEMKEVFKEIPFGIEMVKVQRLFAKTNLKIRVCGAKRNNESPSGAFKRPNGLALARWRGLAPTSSRLSR